MPVDGFALASTSGCRVVVLARTQAWLLKQILINLLTNAVKFSHPGGWVAVDVYRGTRETLVAVRDNGIGIAPENEAAIFEAFRQVSAVGSAKQEGSGLGLSLVKQLVELHGGRVWVESELGRGAVFIFSIPDRSLDA